MVKLKEHETTHTGEKQFASKESDKRYILNDKLKEHRMTHTGEKPFVCKGCNKTFIVQDEFKEHQMTHTVQEDIHTGEKPFDCAKCHKNFGLKSELRAHEIAHKRQIKWEARVARVATVVANYKDSHPHMPMPGETVYKDKLKENT